jgi:hypothetical protein
MSNRSTIIGALVIGGAALSLSACASDATVAPAAAPSDAKKADVKVAAAADTNQLDPIDQILAQAGGTSFSSRSDMRLRTGASRGNLKPVGFTLKDLPIAMVPQALEQTAAPKTTTGAGATEITLKNNGGGGGYGYGGNAGNIGYFMFQVTGGGFASGNTNVGGYDAYFYSQNSYQYGGASVSCGNFDSVTPARWEGMVIDGKSSDGKSDRHYEIVDAWFDHHRCVAVPVRRTRIEVKEIIPDRVFAFRQCDSLACDGKQDVAVVGRNIMNAASQDTKLRSQNGQLLSRMLLPVRRGSAESLILQVADGDKYGSAGRTVSIEITQGVNDPEPIAVAFESSR